MLYAPLLFKNYETTYYWTLQQSVMSKIELRKIQTADSEALLEELPAPEFKIQIENGALATVRKQVLTRFSITSRVFEETFADHGNSFVRNVENVSKNMQ